MANKGATEKMANILIKKAKAYGLVARKRKHEGEFGDLRVMVSGLSVALFPRSDRGEDFIYCIAMDLPEDDREDGLHMFFMFEEACEKHLEQEGEGF